MLVSRSDDILPQHPIDTLQGTITRPTLKENHRLKTAERKGILLMVRSKSGEKTTTWDVKKQNLEEKNNGSSTSPTSTGEFTGFLNHQQYP